MKLESSAYFVCLVSLDKSKEQVIYNIHKINISLLYLPVSAVFVQVSICSTIITTRVHIILQTFWLSSPFPHVPKLLRYDRKQGAGQFGRP